MNLESKAGNPTDRKITESNNESFSSNGSNTSAFISAFVSAFVNEIESGEYLKIAS